MKMSNLFSWEATGVVTGTAVATALLTTLATKYTQNGTPKAIPSKWIRVGTVAELSIYPIKSCSRVSVPEGIVTSLGLRGVESELLRDRVFMVVDSNGVFQVQKEYPKLAVIEFSAVGRMITLKAPEMTDITFQLPDSSRGKERTCRIFLEDKLKGLDCGDAVAEWINGFLKSNGFRLIYHSGDKTQRHLSDLQKSFPLTSARDLATFQNYTSYLLVGQESVDELNKHLKESVTFKNFRPSIVISGMVEPFAEIKWGAVRIGTDVIFRASKPCERCSIVTVNQSTGIRDVSGDPLKTLTKLKPEFDDEQVKGLLKGKGIMGLQMGLHELTPENLRIKVGDPVYVALL